MRYRSLWLIPLLCAASCSKKGAEETGKNASQVLLATSFENLDGWVPENPSLTTEKAHTGKYSTKIDPNIEYSLTYINKLERLSPQRINKLRLSAWTMLTKPGTANLVFQIIGPDQSNVFYEKFDIDKVGEWAKVEKELTLPAVMDPTSQVRVYMWRASATGAAYLDDVQLQVVQ